MAINASFLIEASESLIGASPAGESGLLLEEALATFKGRKLNLRSISGLEPGHDWIDSNSSSIKPRPKVTSEFSQQETAELKHLGVRTNDALRTLIQSDKYPGTKKHAAIMEEIIALARDRVLSGSIKTGNDLERMTTRSYIERIYGVDAGPGLPDFSRRLSFSQEPLCAVIENKAARADLTSELAQKHFPYLPAIARLVGNKNSHTALATINGIDLEFIQTIKSPLSFASSDFYWRLPSKESPIFDATAKRRDVLFDELLSITQSSKTPHSMNYALDIVSEMEWFDAQTWRYHLGTSGSAAVYARTASEIANVHTGRLALGIDPNLEALTRPLDEYKRVYPRFFASTPSWY